MVTLFAVYIPLFNVLHSCNIPISLGVISVAFGQHFTDLDTPPSGISMRCKERRSIKEKIESRLRIIKGYRGKNISLL
jgi:hypothetical protein